MHFVGQIYIKYIMDLHLFYVENLRVYVTNEVVCAIIVPYLQLNHLAYKAEVIDELKFKFRGHSGSGVALDTCEEVIFSSNRGIKYWIQTRIHYRQPNSCLLAHLGWFYTFK